MARILGPPAHAYGAALGALANASSQRLGEGCAAVEVEGLHEILRLPAPELMPTGPPSAVHAGPTGDRRWRAVWRSNSTAAVEVNSLSAAATSRGLWPDRSERGIHRHLVSATSRLLLPAASEQVNINVASMEVPPVERGRALPARIHQQGHPLMVDVHAVTALKRCLSEELKCRAQPLHPAVTRPWTHRHDPSHATVAYAQLRPQRHRHFDGLVRAPFPQRLCRRHALISIAKYEVLAENEIYPQGCPIAHRIPAWRRRKS